MILMVIILFGLKLVNIETLIDVETGWNNPKNVEILLLIWNYFAADLQVLATC